MLGRSRSDSRRPWRSRSGLESSSRSTSANTVRAADTRAESVTEPAITSASVSAALSTKPSSRGRAGAHRIRYSSDIEHRPKDFGRRLGVRSNAAVSGTATRCRETPVHPKYSDPFVRVVVVCLMIDWGTIGFREWWPVALYSPTPVTSVARVFSVRHPRCRYQLVMPKLDELRVQSAEATIAWSLPRLLGRRARRPSGGSGSLVCSASRRSGTQADDATNLEIERHHS